MVTDQRDPRTLPVFWKDEATDERPADVLPMLAMVEKVLSRLLRLW
jgi:hypothetical protein